ncbi:MAG: cytochrome c3 family protein [bacterium]|nr:cytochrome c3 family protein [bacterium]
MKRNPRCPRLFLLLCTTLWIVLVSPVPAETVRQPIAYNHYKHTQELELECVMCHVGAEKEVRATIPGVETCIGCHSEPITENPEEEKIRQYYSRNEEIPWQRLFQVPEHVFFSHRRHVTVAGLECERCHGDMAMREEPPPKPPMKISMGACMTCHRALQASIDCVACHR